MQKTIVQVVAFISPTYLVLNVLCVGHDYLYMDIYVTCNDNIFFIQSFEEKNSLIIYTKHSI